MKITQFQKDAAAQVRLMIGAQLQAMGRQDAELTAFVPRELEAIIAGAYRKLYPELMGRSLVPLQDGIPAWAETVKYNIYDRFGVAKLISAYGDDLPRADIVKDEVRSPIRSFGDAYGFNVDELMASEAGQLPLDAEKANAARMAYEEKIDRIVANGDSAAKLVGLLNITNALAFVVPNGGAGHHDVGDPEDHRRDPPRPEQLLPVHDRPDERRAPHAPDRAAAHAVRAHRQHAALAESDTTILQYLPEQPPRRRGAELVQAEGRGAAGADRMVGYIPDSQFISFVENQPYTQYPPQAKNLELVVNCKGKSGGVICKYPFTVAYADGI
jgi:hypothetical protein